MKSKTILNLWAVLTLAFSGLVLLWFMNIVVFGEVCYYDKSNNKKNLSPALVWKLLK